MHTCVSVFLCSEALWGCRQVIISHWAGSLAHIDLSSAQLSSAVARLDRKLDIFCHQRVSEGEVSRINIVTGRVGEGRKAYCQVFVMLCCVTSPYHLTTIILLSTHLAAVT